MPTIIALDTSLSMKRTTPGSSDQTYHQLALKGISQLLNKFAFSKLEYVCLVAYSSKCEVKVDFTRDYARVREAAKKVRSGDKACILSMLKSCCTEMTTSWGGQNARQVVVFTDCGIGFGNTSIKNFLEKRIGEDIEAEYAWLKTLHSIKLNFVCMGLHSDNYFKSAVDLYQKFVNFVSLKGQLFLVKHSTTCANERRKFGFLAMCELIKRLYGTSYRSFEVILKCGGYFRLESPVLLWPPPESNLHENDKLEVCGYLELSEIGRPASLSQHLILAKMEGYKSKWSSKKSNRRKRRAAKPELDPNSANYEYEKLERDIQKFYIKEMHDTGNDADDASDSNNYKETLCSLLHGALKLENLAALVLLSDSWFGFIYAFSDSNNRSNLMLNILPPGNNVIPWLGDLQNLGFADELQPGETSTFPVEVEARSYSQNHVAWINRDSLNYDVKKLLRQARNIPNNTQNFYEELNRVRRAALSIGFVELLEALATLLEEKCTQLSLNNPGSGCTIQLLHAVSELRKTRNHDVKVSITPYPKFESDDSSGRGLGYATIEGSASFIY